MLERLLCVGRSRLRLELLELDDQGFTPLDIAEDVGSERCREVIEQAIKSHRRHRETQDELVSPCCMLEGSLRPSHACGAQRRRLKRASGMRQARRLPYPTS